LLATGKGAREQKAELGNEKPVTSNEKNFPMTIYSVIFYLLAAILLGSTILAITRRQAIHAVVYLIVSFIATALLFYLLGAPFLALLEVIVYAGAIMVLFLFIVMMLRPKAADQGWQADLAQWAPAIVLGVITLILAAWMVSVEPGARVPLPILTASPLELGRFLFQKYWFIVEVASFLLLIGLVGALYLGRQEKGPGKSPGKEGL
jgi:NADH-quinone oxidoreductase subunit J